MNYKGSGMSVMEMSHRSAAFDGIWDEAQRLLRQAMDIPDNYKVLFMQFSAIPLNLHRSGRAHYVVTGHLSGRAVEEGAKYTTPRIRATSKATGFDRIPGQAELELDPQADFVHICFNNTVYGTTSCRSPRPQPGSC